MHAEPTAEHRWLHQLVGDWKFEAEWSMSPDQSPMKHTGSEIVRSLGGLWTIGEGIGEMPDGTTHTSIMTLGYDAQKGRFIGSFVASMMTFLWLYDGSLNTERNILTLDSSGPSFSGDGSIVQYQDIIEIVDDHHRIMSSQALGNDGTWTKFMTTHYFRKNN